MAGHQLEHGAVSEGTTITQLIADVIPISVAGEADKPPLGFGHNYSYISELSSSDLVMLYRQKAAELMIQYRETMSQRNVCYTYLDSNAFGINTLFYLVKGGQ